MLCRTIGSIFVSFLLVTSAWGDLYVTQDGTGAKDGTHDAPWSMAMLAANYAAVDADNGTTFVGGTITSQIAPTADGESDNWIQIYSWETQYGAASDNPGMLSGTQVDINGYDYIDINGLDIDGPETSTPCVNTRGGSEHTKLRNLHIHDAQSLGMSLGSYGTSPPYSRYVLVENCHIHDVGSEGIYGSPGLLDCTLRGNIIHDVGKAALGGDDQGDGIEFKPYYTGEVRPESTMIIEDNIIYSPDADGDAGVYAISINTKAIVRNNYIYNLGSAKGIRCAASRYTQVADDYGEDVDGAEIYNNIVVGGNPGIIIAGNASQSQSNTKVYNNTLITPNTDGITWTINTNFATNTYLKNNLFVLAAEEAGDRALNLNNGVDPATAIAQSNNNCFYDPDGTGTDIITASGSAKTFSEWKALIGDDANSIQSNPSLDANYRPQSGSPVINAGTDLSGIVDDDKDGIPRPQGPAYDIGAYEYYYATVRGVSIN